eukprot:2195004-Alexandrium_andersonii.AAC.1
MARGGTLQWHGRLAALPGIDRVTLEATPRLGAQRIEFHNEEWAVRSQSPPTDTSRDDGAPSSPGCSPTQPYQEDGAEYTSLALAD